VSGSKFDLIVIGSGPGGQRAAVQAAKLKKSVLIVEKEGLGGACLHSGTIPSKTLREAALNPATVVHDTLRAVMETKQKVIQGETEVIRQQLTRNGVEIAQGTACFLSPREIQITDSKAKTSMASSDHIVIATGTRPYRPKDLDFSDGVLFDSDSILGISQLPPTLAIIGAGVIGCEYASIFAKLGAQVTVFDRRTTLLRGIDTEVLNALENHFRSSHITLKLGEELRSLKKTKSAQGRSAMEIHFGSKKYVVDAVLYCMGRSGNVEELNLKAAGLTPLDRGLLTVNKFYQTTQPHIYAVGDVIGFPALAASSAEQGRLAALHAFGIDGGEFPASFPFGIYTIPEISTCGSDEEALKKEDISYVVGRAHYRELARGKILGDDFGFLKLFVDSKSRKILGVHIIGTGATELVHIGQIAMSLGASIDLLVNNVFNYPTLAEAYKVAALNAANQLRIN
jgi:NAD(P) transhydrogenase